MDGLDFNVWGETPETPAPAPEAPQPRPISSLKPIEFEDEAFSSSLDDDLGRLAPHEDDDEFGDFGEFGDVTVGESFDEGEMGDFGQVSFQNPDELENTALPPDPGPSTWTPLRLRPIPPREDLIRDVDKLLAPAFGYPDPDTIYTSDPIREIEGIGQILVTPSSRNLYEHIFNPPSNPPIPAPNWIQSRIHRQHLIALGIPVNLDEVLPAQPPSRAMPVMHIQTEATSRPRSAPPGPRNGVIRGTKPRESQSNARTPQRSPERVPSIAPRATAASTLVLGPKPELDRSRVDAELALTRDRLSLLPLPTLQAHFDSLRGLLTTTSELLSHLLQEREALQQDSETYNKLIAELITEAQKQKMGGKVKPGKRGSTHT